MALREVGSPLKKCFEPRVEAHPEFLHFEDRGVKPDAVHSVTCGVVVEAGEKSGLEAFP